MSADRRSAHGGWDGTPRKQAERTADARARLLAAAAKLGARDGFDLTSVAAIGDEAGMSRGAVNFHFGTKDRLLAELLDVARNGWRSGLLQARGSARGASWRDELAAQWTWWTEDPTTSRTLLMYIHEANGPSPELRLHVASVLAEARRYATTRIIERQTAGEVARALDAGAVARLLINSLLGMIAVQALGDVTDPGAEFEELCAVLEAHAATPRGS